MVDAGVSAAGKRAVRPRHKTEERLLLLWGWSLLSTAACAVTSARAPGPEPTPPASPAEFDESAVALPRYHSRRLAVSLPLPGGRAWIIDDHSRAALVAKDAATQSTVVVAVLRTSENVGRDQCEVLAKSQGLAITGPLNVVEDEITMTQKTFDTRIRVALEAATGPDRPLVGHVTAFGGFLHKCFVFDFSTRVDDASGEPALSARLAFARTRILAGLEIDAFASVPARRPADADTNATH